MTNTNNTSNNSNSNTMSDDTILISLQAMKPDLSKTEIEDIFNNPAKGGRNFQTTLGLLAEHEMARKKKPQGDGQPTEAKSGQDAEPEQEAKVNSACPLLLRIGNCLRIYAEFNKTQDAGLLAANIDLNATMNDYSKLVSIFSRTNPDGNGADGATICDECDSDDGHTFEQVYHYLVRECLNGQACPCVARNFRDQAQDVRAQASNVTILDTMHTFFLHAYDSGSLLTQKEKTEIRRMIAQRQAEDDMLEQEEDADDAESKTEDDNTSSNQGFINIQDSVIQRVGAMLSSRIEQFETVRHDQISVAGSDSNSNSNSNTNNSSENSTAPASKFVTYISKDEPVNVALQYSFGYPFNYDKQKEARKSEWWVPHKYGSFKTELLQNAIRNIPIIAWQETLQIAEEFLLTNYIRQLEYSGFPLRHDHNHTAHEDRKIWTDMSLNHILSILFYCNFTKLSYEFSKSFRKLHTHETSQELIARHSNYRIWARYLHFMVNGFGSTGYKVGKSNTAHLYQAFYHGVSVKMLFDSCYARLNSPTSTSTSMPVAIKFAKTGIVVQFEGASFFDEFNNAYFDCRLLSKFPIEFECLFFKTFVGRPIAFASILDVKNKINYRPYIQALRCFAQMWACYSRYSMTALNAKILGRLVNIRLAKSRGNNSNNHKTKTETGVPDYILNLFDLVVEKFTKLQLDCDDWEKFTKCKFNSIFFDVGSPGPFGYTILNIKFWVFNQLFSKLRHIDFMYLAFRKSMLDSIYDTYVNVDANENAYQSIRKIEFSDPTFVNPNFTVEQCLHQYKAKFEAKEWQLNKNGSFGVDITKN